MTGTVRSSLRLDLMYQSFVSHEKVPRICDQYHSLKIEEYGLPSPKHLPTGTLVRLFFRMRSLMPSIVSVSRSFRESTQGVSSSSLRQKKSLSCTYWASKDNSLGMFQSSESFLAILAGDRLWFSTVLRRFVLNSTIIINWLVLVVVCERHRIGFPFRVAALQ